MDQASPTTVTSASSEPYIYTLDKGKLHFLNPHPDEIDFHTIAHSISRKGRFADQTVKRFTVGQHSLVGYHIIMGFQPRLAPVFLLHDASEGYLQDIPTPIKNFLPEYKKIENQLMQVIMRKAFPKWYKHQYEKPWIVDLVDRRLRHHEARFLDHPFQKYDFGSLTDEEEHYIEQVDQAAPVLIETVAKFSDEEVRDMILGYLNAHTRKKDGNGIAPSVPTSGADSKTAA